MSAMYDQIQALCRQNATNITAMCRALGIPRSVLSELRSGRTRELSVQNLRKIAEYFDVPLDSLSHASQPEALAMFPPPEDYFTSLYMEARELNEENRQKLLDLAHILLLAQRQQTGAAPQKKQSAPQEEER